MKKKQKIHRIMPGRFGFTLRQFAIMYLIVLMTVLGFQHMQLQDVKKRQEYAIQNDIHYDLEIADFLVDSMNGSIRDLFMGMLTREDIFEEGNQDTVIHHLGTIRSNNTVVNVLYSSSTPGMVYSSNNAWFRTGSGETVMDMMESARERPNRVQYSSPYYSYMVAGYSVCAAMADSTGTRVVAAELNLGQLYSSLASLLRGNGRTFFMTDKDNILIMADRNSDQLFFQKGVYPLQLLPEMKQLLEKQGEQEEVEVSLPHKANYCYQISSGNELLWKIVAVYQPDVLYDGLDESIRRIYLFTLIVLLLLGLILLAAVFSLTRPLRSLAGMMDGIRNIEDLTVIENIRKDEIGLLQDSYNKLILRIRELMHDLQETEDKKKEYEIKMLQDQIGPHFLHNTLTCLLLLIRRGKGKQAADGIHALLGLLTYSFESTGEMTTVEKELEVLSDYIYIEKLRYGEIFTYETRVEDSVRGMKIPKLTIQPILENAIFHGVLSRETDDGKIIVSIRERNSILLIRVFDNGTGIPPDKVVQVLAGGSSQKEGRNNRIGVKNVNERIRLLYGSNYGIILHSSPKGTVVHIRLPICS